VSYAQTQGLVYVSLVNLYKAMGGGWVATAENMTNKQEQKPTPTPTPTASR
jgi:multidrug efflux system outer membrane protein